MVPRVDQVVATTVAEVRAAVRAAFITVVVVQAGAITAVEGRVAIIKAFFLTFIRKFIASSLLCTITVVAATTAAAAQAEPFITGLTVPRAVRAAVITAVVDLADLLT